MENVLEVKDLVVRFDTDDGIVRAINGISFSIGRDALSVLSMASPSASAEREHWDLWVRPGQERRRRR